MKEFQLKQAIKFQQEKHAFEMAEAEKQSKRQEREHQLRLQILRAELQKNYGFAGENNSNNEN